MPARRPTTSVDRRDARGRPDRCPLGRARIAATLTESGRPAEARPVEEVTSVAGYDAVVLGGAAIWYFASAKNWFKGPKVQGTPEELRAIELDLEVI